MELMQLNTYVENKYQIEDRKEKEKNGTSIYLLPSLNILFSQVVKNC